MLYDRDLSNEYIELIHLLTDNNLLMSLYDKRKLDNKILNLLRLLKELKEKNSIVGDKK